MQPGKGMRASCGKSTRARERSWSRSRCQRARVSPASNPMAATASSAAEAPAGSCGSSGARGAMRRRNRGPAESALKPDSLPGARAPPQEQRHPEEHDVDDHGRPAALGAIAQLRQEVKPTLARREDHDVRERHEYEPAYREDERDRHSDIAGATQTHAAAEIQAVEELIRRREPEQLHPEVGR